VVTKRSAFSTLASAQNGGEYEGEYKVEDWNTNFHKWKGIWIYKKSLNQLSFQR
jgi:hypothetical protein